LQCAVKVPDRRSATLQPERFTVVDCLAAGLVLTTRHHHLHRTGRRPAICVPGSLWATDMNSSFIDVSERLLGMSPLLIVAFAGIVLCVNRDSRPVRVRIAIGCALGLQMASLLVMPFVFSYIIQLYQSNSIPGGTLSNGILALSVFSSSVSAVALALLLWAALTSDDLPPEIRQST
jgi:hypothetical protein